MPDCRLIRFSPVLPGGFRITVMFPNGQTQRLRAFDMDSISTQLLVLRQNNGLPGATFGQCWEDISMATCREFGCDPKYCTDGTNSIKAPPPRTEARKGCGSCGRKKK